MRGIQRAAFFKDVDWAVYEAKKVSSPLQRSWYVREPDVSASRQFRNGEDINRVVEKLQHISLDSGRGAGGGADESEANPGMIPNWDYINPRVVYNEYLYSPYHNVKSTGL